MRSWRQRFSGRAVGCPRLAAVCSRPCSGRRSQRRVLDNGSSTRTSCRRRCRPPPMSASRSEHRHRRSAGSGCHPVSRQRPVWSPRPIASQAQRIRTFSSASAGHDRIAALRRSDSTNFPDSGPVALRATSRGGTNVRGRMSDCVGSGGYWATPFLTIRSISSTDFDIRWLKIAALDMGRMAEPVGARSSTKYSRSDGKDSMPGAIPSACSSRPSCLAPTADRATDAQFQMRYFSARSTVENLAVES